MLRTILFLVLGLYLMIVGLVTWVGFDSINHSHESARNTIALCALRDNVHKTATERQHQIDRSMDFLDKHPNGIPGLSAGFIRKGLADSQITLAGQRRTIAALSILHCD